MREVFTGKLGDGHIIVTEFASDDYRWFMYKGGGGTLVARGSEGCKTMKEALCAAIDSLYDIDNTLDGVMARSYIYIKDKAGTTAPFYVWFFRLAKRELFGRYAGSSHMSCVSLDDVEVVHKHVRLYSGSELFDFVGRYFVFKNSLACSRYKAVEVIPEPTRLVLTASDRIVGAYEPSELAENFYLMDDEKNLVDFLKIED